MMSDESARKEGIRSLIARSLFVRTSESSFDLQDDLGRFVRPLLSPDAFVNVIGLDTTGAAQISNFFIVEEMIVGVSMFADGVFDVAEVDKSDVASLVASWLGDGKSDAVVLTLNLVTPDEETSQRELVASAFAMDGSGTFRISTSDDLLDGGAERIGQEVSNWLTQTLSVGSDPTLAED